MQRNIDHPQSRHAEIEAVTEAWANNYNSRQAASLAMLYDPDVVLWGTLSPEMVSTPEGVRRYFDAICAAPIALRASFDEQLIRTCGDAMLNSGRYTFAFVQDGHEQSFAARFSMTFRKQGSQWLIPDHQSSARPVSLASQPNDN